MEVFRPNSSRLSVCLIAFFCTYFSIPSFSDTAEPLTARELLTRQSIAMTETNFTGVLTYEHGAHLATMEITHHLVNGFEHERLVHLNGDVREVQRAVDNTHCPHVGPRLLRGMFGGSLLSSPDIEKYYHVAVVGTERVAGRNATLVQVMPKDQYRYGYVVSIDQSSYLALKTLLIGPGARVLERFQFAQLNIEPGEPQTRLTSNESSNAGDLAGCENDTKSESSEWEVNWLPPGFTMAGQRHINADRLMLMFTDGLAAFSVFIDKLDAPSTIEGKAQRGATVAYMGRAEGTHGDYRVTVVGELPLQSLERVALSLREKKPTALDNE